MVIDPNEVSDCSLTLKHLLYEHNLINTTNSTPNNNKAAIIMDIVVSLITLQNLDLESGE